MLRLTHTRTYCRHANVNTQHIHRVRLGDRCSVDWSLALHTTSTHVLSNTRLLTAVVVSLCQLMRISLRFSQGCLLNLLGLDGIVSSITVISITIHSSIGMITININSCSMISISISVSIIIIISISSSELFEAWHSTSWARTRGLSKGSAPMSSS